MRRLSVVALVCACGSSQPPAADLGWMASIDDAKLLSELSIPGTHESAALYEPLTDSSTAKCQTLTLAQQLDVGVRYFDIRCRHLDDTFQIFHGPISELMDFDMVLATMSDFLAAHPTETVVMSIKNESTEANNTTSYEDLFAAYVAKDPGLWYLGATVPALGTVRGKIVLVRRFAATAVVGIDASAWADNTTFTLTDADATLRVEDAYMVTSTDTKWSEITSLFGEAEGGTGATLYLDYTSGYQLKGALPNIASVANVINPQLDAYLADPANAHAHLGVVAMDLVTETRPPAVARTNLP